MASERNRILNLIKYVESCGIEVNVGRNKARGNKGFFKAVNNCYRIDIAKELSEDAIVATLAHEFAHYVHFNHDKSLRSLDFVFDDSESVLEELIAATVEMIPKHTVKPLFEQKNAVKKEIEELIKKIQSFAPDFSYTTDSRRYEKNINKTNLKYLLKYDRVKVLEGFSIKYYSVDALSEESEAELFLKLKSKKRMLNRINSRINRLNRYYNSPTELFARGFELYVTDKKRLSIVAPKVADLFARNITHTKNSLLFGFVKSSLY